MAGALRRGVAVLSSLCVQHVARSTTKQLARSNFINFNSSMSLAKPFCSSSSIMSKAAIQKPAPHFQGTAVTPEGDFIDVKLSDYKGKYLVFFFYPLDFTFVCPTEIISFSDKASEFHDINCEVVGVSVDSHFTHLAWTNTPRKAGGLGNIHIPLLSDLNKQISRDYGVLLEGPGIAL